MAGAPSAPTLDVDDLLGHGSPVADVELRQGPAGVAGPCRVLTLVSAFTHAGHMFDDGNHPRRRRRTPSPAARRRRTRPRTRTATPACASRAVTSRMVMEQRQHSLDAAEPINGVNHLAQRLRLTQERHHSDSADRGLRGEEPEGAEPEQHSFCDERDAVHRLRQRGQEGRCPRRRAHFRQRREASNERQARDLQEAKRRTREESPAHASTSELDYPSRRGTRRWPRNSTPRQTQLRKNIASSASSSLSPIAQGCRVRARRPTIAGRRARRPPAATAAG